MRARVLIFDRVERDRWVAGDRHVRAPIRRLLRAAPRPGGLDRVRLNLCRGLELLGVPYRLNGSYRDIRPGDRVGVLGRGTNCLRGYAAGNPIVAGVGLMTHPSEWPSLCDEHPVAMYLQHSAWAAAVYRPHFGDRCRVWPVGIDTAYWAPEPSRDRDFDMLLYDKTWGDGADGGTAVLAASHAALAARGLRVRAIRYGEYEAGAYRDLLARSRALLFLSAHESQGLAYQEALAMDVPVLAWDPGRYFAAESMGWTTAPIASSSVPWFDDRCGMRFRGVPDLEPVLDAFVDGSRAGAFAPRAYVLERLTLERCARAYLDLLEEASA